MVDIDLLRKNPGLRGRAQSHWSWLILTHGETTSAEVAEAAGSLRGKVAWTAVLGDPFGRHQFESAHKSDTAHHTFALAGDTLWNPHFQETIREIANGALVERYSEVHKVEELAHPRKLRWYRHIVNGPPTCGMSVRKILVYIHYPVVTGSSIPACALEAINSIVRVIESETDAELHVVLRPYEPNLKSWFRVTLIRVMGGRR